MRLLLAAMLAAAPAHAAAYDVLVVQSFENPVYAKTIEGYGATVGGTLTVATLDKDKKLPADATERIHKKPPAAILTIGPSALSAVLAEKPSIPVLFTAVTGKAEDARPAAGVLMNVPMDRQVDTLLKIAPSVKTIGVVYNPEKTQYFVDDLGAAARARGLTLKAEPASSPPDAVKKLNGLLPTIDAYLFAPDTTIHSEQLEKAAGSLSIKQRIPIVGFKGAQLANGFLFASEMDPVEMGKQAGTATKDLLNGKRPSPAYAPVRKFKLVLNAKVADRLGLTIPKEVSAAATFFGEP